MTWSIPRFTKPPTLYDMNLGTAPLFMARPNAALAKARGLAIRRRKRGKISREGAYAAPDMTV
ncbi:hypothetical protein BBB39_02780 [Bordetella trematum]|nr:hypothetical protein BTL55_02935 [Bordetella trematum]AZR92813.1 hypothetical protein BBB39_02780 [Bordetella trematum]